MAKEHPQPTRLDEIAQEIFQPRLYRAQRQFHEIALQISQIDPLNLPPRLHLLIDESPVWSSVTTPAKQIANWIYNDNGYPPRIIHVFQKSHLPDHCLGVLLLPEIDVDQTICLSLGIFKRQNNQFFTGWADSHFALTARRQDDPSDLLKLVQYVYALDHTDHATYNEIANDQQMLNITHGFMYLFTPASPVEEHPPLLLAPTFSPAR